MSNLAGLGIALLTILAICGLWYVIKAVFWLADSFQEMILDRDVHIIWKLLFLLPWLLFRAFTIIFIIAGLLCGISLVKDAWKWFDH